MITAHGITHVKTLLWTREWKVTCRTDIIKWECAPLTLLSWQQKDSSKMSRLVKKKNNKSFCVTSVHIQFLVATKYV